MAGKIKQTITTNNDRVSQSKIWANVGSAVATWVIIYMTLHDRMTWEIFFAYLGTVAGFTQISKFLSYKYGAVQNVADTKDSPKPNRQQESDKFEPGD